MSENEKKKKSVFKIILNVILTLVAIVIVTGAAGGAYLYFKFNVNPFTMVSQLSKLKETVDRENIVDNAYSTDDLSNAKLKIDANLEDNVIKIKDTEVAAYVADSIKKGNENIKFDLLGVEINLDDCEFELLQIKFDNIGGRVPDGEIADFNVIFKISAQKLKNNYFSTFPMSLAKNIFPNYIYISSTVHILDATDAAYKVESADLKINNLDSNQTKALIEDMNKFAEFDSLEKINIKIGGTFVDYMLGDSGFYGKLKDKGATGYSFEELDNKSYFDVYTVDLNEQKTITYSGTKGASNSNLTTYHITDNIIKLVDLKLYGYNFLGWYLDDEKVTTIDAGLFINFNVEARWEIITYTITLDLNDGSYNGETTIQYNVETPVVLPSTATKVVDEVENLVRGWACIEDGRVIEDDFTIPAGEYGNKTYKAYYYGDTAKITLSTDYIGSDVVYYVNVGEKLNASTVIDNKQLGMNGYFVNKWYTNSSMQEIYEFDFDTTISDDVKLYGNWEYITNNVYFYQYLAEFNGAVSNISSLSFNNREKFIAYMDYVIFYNVKTKIDLNLNYIVKTSANIIAEFNEAYNEYRSRDCYRLGTVYIEYTNLVARLYVNDGDFVENPTKMDSDSSLYEQQTYALKTENESPRAADFNDFNINKVSNVLSVKTSEQLVWALENGYRPICEIGSPAERIYNKAKVILRQICNDDMDDIEKLNQIYQWLVINVQYDNDAAYLLENGLISASNAKLYDSWYAEGVFDSNKAVCEGFAKAFLIMAEIENIPTIFVTGNEHAWNKVFVDGKWYGIDATHGNLETEFGSYSVETISFSSFMFTDEYKQNCGYTTTDYAEFTATTAFNWFDSFANYEYSSHNIDLYIDSCEELTLVYQMVKDVLATTESDSSYIIFVIYFSNANYSNFTSPSSTSWRRQAASISGLNVIVNSWVPVNGQDGYECILFISNAA